MKCLIKTANCLMFPVKYSPILDLDDVLSCVEIHLNNGLYTVYSSIESSGGLIDEKNLITVEIFDGCFGYRLPVVDADR